MIQAEGDGVKLNVATWKGEGKTILCVHGLTSNCRVWDTIASALTPQYRVLAMDLRGRGHSGHPSSGYSLDHHCRDISCLLDDLELERSIVMGHSLGAHIALYLAAHYPHRVEKAILVDGGGQLSEAQRAQVYKGIEPSLGRLGKVFPSFDAYLEDMKQLPFLKTWPATIEVFYRHDMEQIEGGGIRSSIQKDHIQEEIVNLRKTDLTECYSNIRCPVLILRAPEGMLSPDDILLPEDVFERMLREIADVKLVNVEGTNHYSIVFNPNQLRDRAIQEFISADA
ncbi:MAG: alpha/beta hydrolase [Deltaproteobacteria bacterium]|nr:alpha/beta hydrolase [Deltaproteobacteria bacterium]MBW2065297.1 alpha/beta hydrolase [Deltaproteobacteria bacterium]